jgi:uncharacterized protein YvpB
MAGIYAIKKVRFITFLLIFLTFIFSSCAPSNTYPHASGASDQASKSAMSTPTPFLPILPSTTFTHSPTLTASTTPYLTATYTATYLLPTDTPQPQEEQINTVMIEGFFGHAQWYLLDCEARSAVDWAAFFGYTIDYKDFLNNLPKSDDPEQGFVGDYTDAQGNIPPAGYGVHADPIAELLRSYDVPAHAVKGMSFNDLESEISAGRPVIVWVIYLVQSGTPISYTASDGNTTTVARFEHTVTVIGYDDARVLVMDGGYAYYRTIDQFLDSWSVLGNMAVVYGDE